MSQWFQKNNPTPSDVHIDMALGNMTLGFMQSADKFVAGRVFPRVPVSQQSNKYHTFNRHDFWRDEMSVRADGTESAGSGFRLSNDSYSCDVYSLHKDLGNQTMSNADSSLQLDRAATMYLAQQRLIRQEKQFATDFFAASKWATDVTPGTLWDDDASDPIGDVATGVEKILTDTGQDANKLVVGYATHKALKEHPDIIARLDRGQTPGGAAKATAADMARIFEVDEYLVMKAIETTSKEGQSTQTTAFIGGKHALLTHTPANVGLMTPVAGATFTWTGLMGATVEGFNVKRWWSDDRSSWRYEIDAAFDMKIVSNVLGYFFSSVVS